MSIDEMEGVVTDTAEDFRINFQLLERAVVQFDSRFTLRAIRSISSLRKKLAESKIAGLKLGKPMQELLSTAERELAGEAKKESVPEVRIYIGLLIQACVPVKTRLARC